MITRAHRSLFVFLVPVGALACGGIEEPLSEEELAAIAAHGLLGEYFGEPGLSGRPTTRVDPEVAFDWGSGPPADGVGADLFSVRWTGTVEARFSERYTFSVASDDGVRLFVGDQRIIDGWQDHARAVSRGSADLVAGQRTPIRLEYYENRGLASCELRWASAHEPEAVIPSVRLLPPLPRPWQSADVGNPLLVGSAGFEGERITLEGAGVDIWDQADAFNFVYQPLSGDGEIVAKVESLQAAHVWSKAGVMIREDLSPGSRHAFAAVTAGSGVAFQRRLATGGLSTHTKGATAKAPYWVKLVRRGDLLTAFASPDGTTFTEVGSDRLGLPSAVLVGLALTSHDVNARATAVFLNTKVTTGVGPGQPPPPPPPPPGPLSGRFVSTTGSDSAPGTESQPWRTINHAVAQLKAGDTLHIRGGIYVEAVRIWVSGTAAAPIKVRAYPNETPIIDGQGRLPASAWGSLLYVGGNYVEVSGLEIRNSASRDSFGVYLGGHHNTLSNSNVHHQYGTGVLASGDYSIVERNRVWESTRVNAGGVCQPVGSPMKCIWGSGLSAARDHEGNGVTENAVIRGNIVYNNWGEGLSTFEASGTLIEDNVVFNNWSVNLYISNAWNTLTQRNLVYVSPDTPIVGARRFPSNISLMDEVVTAMFNHSIRTISHDNVVINNVSIGSGNCIMCWSTSETIAAGAGLKNVLFAHNTVIDGSLTIGNYTNSGSRFINNIFSTANLSVSARGGIEFSHNLWAADPGSLGRGPGDQIGNANLTRGPAFTNSTYSKEYFKLTPQSSLALGRGLSLPVVGQDFFKRARGAEPDLGAHELP